MSLVQRLPGEQGGVFIASYVLAEFTNGTIIMYTVYQNLSMVLANIL